MRFMVIMYPGPQAEAGVMPDTKLLTEMGKYNEELVKAGVLLAGDGLHPTSKGARVTFAGKKTSVADGPFAESKEAIGGYFYLQVADENEAIEIAKQCPGLEYGAAVEVRPVADECSIKQRAQEYSPGQLAEATA